MRETAKEMLRERRRLINIDAQKFVLNFHAMQHVREMSKSALTVEGVLELH